MAPVSSSAVFFLLSITITCTITAFQVAAHAQTSSANSAVHMVSWHVKSVHDASFVMDRVALLTTEREDPDAPWCMGLLVAPDALLTYAHCVAEITKQENSDKRISWAFFGNTMESFYAAQSQHDGPETGDDDEAGMMKRQVGAVPSTDSAANDSSSTERTNATPMNGTTATNSSSRRWLESEDVEVGDVANWVEVIEVILHPEFNQTSNTSTSSSAADMAIVRIAVPRDTEPFQLLPDVVTVESSTNVQMTNPLEAYRVTNAFISDKNAPKTQSIGPFRKVNWFFCALASNGSTVAERKNATASQMCVIPEAVSKRVPLSTIDSFVLVGDQLAGLSVCHSKACKRAVVHPYVLVSAIKDFIKLATRKQDVWTDMGLFTIGGSDAMLQGYLSGIRKTKDAANFCLGSLIGSQFVLTAAHCVKDVAFSYVSVGSKFAFSVSDGEQIKVKSVKIHPEFNPNTLLNDFALVELQYMSIQRPLVLDNEGDQQLYSSTTSLTLYGYSGGGSGDVKQSVDKPVVQSLTLPLVKNAVCNSLIGDSSLDAAIVCAGGDQGKDGCQGDSGAPLVQESSGSSDPPFLVAQSSFGWGCGLKAVPAVYAKVSAARSFIDKNAQGHTWRYPLDQGSAGGTTTPSGSSTSTTTGSNGLAENSPTPSTMSPSEEERSGEGATSGDQQHHDPAATAGMTTQKNAEEIVESICREEKWTCAASISLLGALQSIVIPATTSQFTRDSVATILLSSKDHVHYEEIRVTTTSDSGSDSSGDSSDAVTLTWYSCAGPIQMYSSGDLSNIDAKLAGFENRPLRRRKARFPRAPGLVRLPAF